MSVPWNWVRHHGSTPPRKQCTPSASWGFGGVVAPPGQFRAGFSEQQFIILARKEIRCRFIILARKDEPTPDYAPEDMLGLEESQGQGPPSTSLCLKGVTMRRLFTLEYWRDGDWYVGRLMEITGVFSQGESLDELRENIQEAYELMVTQDRTATPLIAERQDVELEV